MEDDFITQEEKRQQAVILDHQFAQRDRQTAQAERTSLIGSQAIVVAELAAAKNRSSLIIGLMTTVLALMAGLAVFAASHWPISTTTTIVERHVVEHPIAAQWINQTMHFRSAEFDPGDSNCFSPKRPCDSWFRMEPGNAQKVAIKELLDNTNGPATLVVLGGHDSQELGTALQKRLHDNEQLAIDRAQNVRAWLQSKLIRPPESPAAQLIVGNRPTENWQRISEMDRTVELTIVTSQRKTSP